MHTTYHLHACLCLVFIYKVIHTSRKFQLISSFGSNSCWWLRKLPFRYWRLFFLPKFRLKTLRVQRQLLAYRAVHELHNLFRIFLFLSSYGHPLLDDVIYEQANNNDHSLFCIAHPYYSLISLFWGIIYDASEGLTFTTKLPWFACLTVL